MFRKYVSDDAISSDQQEPPCDWVIEANGAVVAKGGFLCHYNPPYTDIYMEVVEAAKRQGFGSFLVQELKRVCYEAGKKPAASCDFTNAASRKTLENAGLLPCGHLAVGEVRSLRIIRECGRLTTDMRRILNQAANAAVKVKGSIFEIAYRRSVPRLGHNQPSGQLLIDRLG
jgi:hypothetical protein